MIVTRFAPSPTGYLHIGHAFAAWTAARAGTRFLLRLEDLDLGRARQEFAAAIFEDLAWLGLSWDEPVLHQSRRFDAYRESSVPDNADLRLGRCIANSRSPNRWGIAI